MNKTKLRIISFIDYSEFDNIFKEFIKHEEVELYSCFLDTMNQNSSTKINSTILYINRINDLKGLNSTPVPMNIMKNIYSKHMSIILRIVNRYSDMLGVFKSFQAIEQKALELIEFCYNHIIITKPNAVFYYDIPHLPIEYCIYILALEMGIETRILFTMQLSKSEDVTMLPARIVDKIDSNPFLLPEEKNHELSIDQSLNNSFITNIDSPKIESASRYRYKSKLKSILKIALNSHDRNYIVRTLVFSLTHRIKGLYNFFSSRKILRNYKRLYSIKGGYVNNSSIYYYFPLHLQPEASTQSRSFLFEDQLYLIKLISKELPDGVKLVIKEHPAYFMRNNVEDISKYRNKRFYETLFSMNNILLSEYSTLSQELIENSNGVISISGSVIMEAYLSNKPALVFGETNYKHLDNVTVVNDESDISKFLHSNLNLPEIDYINYERKDKIQKLLKGFDYLYFYDIDSKNNSRKNAISIKITKLFLESMTQIL